MSGETQVDGGKYAFLMVAGLLLLGWALLQRSKTNEHLEFVVRQMAKDSEAAALERADAKAERVALQAHRAREENHWRQWGGDRVIPGPGFRPGSSEPLGQPAPDEPQKTYPEDAE